MHRWWLELDGERFWLEITDRSDVGADLNAPEFNEAGNPQWSYDLIHEPAQGDVVFHFLQHEEAIVGYSFAAGESWRDQVARGAQGTSARPGVRRGLRGYTPIEPVTLEQIRVKEPEIVELRDRLQASVGAPLYFPFVPYTGQPLRPFQGSFVKLPAELVGLLSLPAVTSDGSAVADDKPRQQSASPIGTAYRIADEHLGVAEAGPMIRDPALVERSLRSHRATQNSLADHVRWTGLEPLSPSVNDQDWDLAWENSGVVYVAEVKCITHQNEERQLRLAVGQVLRYRQQLRLRHDEVVAVIAASVQPNDRSWSALCASLGIVLTWPGCFVDCFPAAN